MAGILGPYEPRRERIHHMLCLDLRIQPLLVDVAVRCLRLALADVAEDARKEQVDAWVCEAVASLQESDQRSALRKTRSARCTTCPGYPRQRSAERFVTPRQSWVGPFAPRRTRGAAGTSGASDHIPVTPPSRVSSARRRRSAASAASSGSGSPGASMIHVSRSNDMPSSIGSTCHPYPSITIPGITRRAGPVISWPGGRNAASLTTS